MMRFIPSSRFACRNVLVLRPAAATSQPSTPLPADSSGHITFGCLNNFCKVNDAVALACGPRFSRRNAGSRLLLLVPEGSRAAKRAGSAGRARALPPSASSSWPSNPDAQYLQTYHRIDIGLDTWPYNGHTTSFDSFWMGVPVITLVGRTVCRPRGPEPTDQSGVCRN